MKHAMVVGGGFAETKSGSPPVSDHLSHFESRRDLSSGPCEIIF